MNKAFQLITAHLETGIKLRSEFFTAHASTIVEMARQIASSVACGGKIIIAGNGGSAADAQHWAGEFVNRFLLDRPPLPAIALTTDSSILTAIGNDFGFHLIFAKQLQAIGQQGDIFLGISTSGNSVNLIEALHVARKQRITTIGLTGKGGGGMAPLCDFLIDVPHQSTPLVQEVHATIGHMLCMLIDYFLFENVSAIQPLLNDPTTHENND